VEEAQSLWILSTRTKINLVVPCQGVSLHSRPVFFSNSIWGHLFNQNDMTSLSIQFTAQKGYFNFDRDKEASQTIEAINAKPNDF